MRQLMNCVVVECAPTRWGLLLLIRHSEGVDNAYYRWGRGRYAMISDGRFRLRQGPGIPTAAYKAGLN